MSKDGKDVKAELARLIAEEPDAQLLVLADMQACEYDSCYESVYDVYVADIVVPSEADQPAATLHDLVIGTWGLDYERWYDYPDEEEEAVESFLWDAGCGGGGRPETDQAAWSKVYGPIAKMIVDDMPKHRCIVIRTDG